MNWLNVLTMRFAGSRTKFAQTGAILVSLAGFVGMLPCDRAIAAAAALIALGGFFQRLATANATSQIGDIGEMVSELLVAITRDPNSPRDPRPTSSDSADEPPPGTILPFRRPLVGCFIALLCLAQSGHGGEPRAVRPSVIGAEHGDRPTVATSMQLSPETRAWFRNPDGSCVQCSIGMAGVHANDINAASLLWDSPYGSAVRGGSWPSRVERYCDERGIKAWSVTAASVDDTLPWMVWAAKTGRFAAIGAGQAHFQTLYGYEPQHERPWLVCNNNSTQRIDRYGETEFRRLHAASGPWVVILERASSDPPELVRWWK